MQLGYKKTSAVSGDRAKVIPIAIGRAKKEVFLGYRGKTLFLEKLIAENQL